MPGTPFGIAVTPDGSGAVVALPGHSGSALAWLSAGAACRLGHIGPWRLGHIAPLASAWVPRGVALAAGGSRAIVAAGAGLLIAEVPALSVAASIPVAGATLVQVTLDASERFAFATDEEGRRVVVFDLSAGAGGIVGEVAVAPGPVGIALADAGTHVLVTSQHSAPGRRDGVVSSFAVADAVEDPARVRVASVAAGCQPVRVAAGPDGRVWVTARGSNSLLAFDEAGLVAGRRDALRSVVRVGAAPVGVAVAGGGAQVVVANSDRYGDADAPQSLSVVEAGAGRGGPRLLGTVAAGVFPREVAVAPDGVTVLVGNFRSQTVQVVWLPG